MPGETRHASAVAVDGRGLLILGASGAGKSRLAIAMIGLGAELVADDQVRLTPRGDDLWMSAPEATRGLIESRGLGLLRCPACGPVPLRIVLDLDRVETKRLPDPGFISVLERDFPLIATPKQGHDAAALILLLRHGLDTGATP